MASMQKLILIGYLGGDPETRYTPSGTAITSFSVATTERWKDKQTQQQQERTTWHRIEAWGRQAEICGEYLHKGDQVYVEGKIRNEEWEDKESGEKRRATKVRLDNVQFLNTKGERPQGGQPQVQTQPQGQQNYPQQGQQPVAAGANDDLDSDIPFSWILAPIGGAFIGVQEMLQMSTGFLA